ncbi:hypothetical protein [Streptomyces sp. NPDC000410]|uniref:O-antigen ligase family protein n=1 Tax=Streptomyces sp. NPDC000410 TaxID=3154254 RepID=UPI00331E0B09
MTDDALPEGLAAVVEERLTPQRVLLWRDAAEIAKAHPVLGAGPGRFGDLSPATQQAPQFPQSDGTPAPAPLQQAAEQGLVGVGLLGSLFGRLLYALWRSPRSTPVVLSAGAALTALVALASVGDALSHTPVAVGAGVLAGLATARESSDTRRARVS